MIKKLYAFIMSEKRVSNFRRVDAFLRKIGGEHYTKTLGQLKYKLRFGRKLTPTDEGNGWNLEKKREGYRPLITVAFCEAQKTAVQAILKRQTYTNYECVLVPNLREDKESFGVDNETSDKEDYLRCLKAAAEGKGAFVWIPDPELPYEEDTLERLVKGCAYDSVQLSFLSEREYGGSNLPKQTFLKEEKTWAESIPIGYGLLRRGMLLKNTAELLQGTSKSLEQCVWQVWRRTLAGGSAYYAGKIPAQDKRRYPLVDRDVREESLRVAMVCYSMRSGGGETFPIYLANCLYLQGVEVSLVNYELEEREEAILSLVEPGLPVYHLSNTGYAAYLFQNLQPDIIHTHQATVDYAVARLLGDKSIPGRQIITLHGMYEVIAKEDCQRTIAATYPVCSRYVYIADKNLKRFLEQQVTTLQEIADSGKFVKLPNGLPTTEITPVSRESLGIDKEDFVLVLASRAIREKGWREAMEACRLAAEGCGRRVQLVLLGDGPCKEELEKLQYDKVHFVGMVSNVKDYFAMGDVGLLPSFYSGESFPLVLIECFMAGRPVIATDIGEVKNMLGEEGNEAGIMISLSEEKVDVKELAGAIVRLEQDSAFYRKCKELAKRRASDFAIEGVAKQYLTVYRQALEETK